MPLIKVWIHFVWSTKNRAPFLNSAIRGKVFQHIRENAKEKAIHIDTINGYIDHAHCLVSLSTDQTIRKLMQMIKGESSFWINKNNLCKGKFEWQDEYYGASVSESDLIRVRKYIQNQEQHHLTKTFQQEYEEFISSQRLKP